MLAQLRVPAARSLSWIRASSPQMESRPAVIPTAGASPLLGWPTVASVLLRQGQVGLLDYRCRERHRWSLPGLRWRHRQVLSGEFPRKPEAFPQPPTKARFFHSSRGGSQDGDEQRGHRPCHPGQDMRGHRPCRPGQAMRGHRPCRACSTFHRWRSLRASRE